VVICKGSNCGVTILRWLRYTARTPTRLAGVSSAREATMNKTPNVACLLLSLLVCAAALPGQTSLSTIRGTVKDPSGLVVPAVAVTGIDIATSVQVRAADTDTNGNFEMPDLKPGIYRLRAELAGFKTFVADNITLEGAQIRRFDIALEVGGVTERITVEAGRAVISTDTAEISTGFTQTLFDAS